MTVQSSLPLSARLPPTQDQVTHGFISPSLEYPVEVWSFSEDLLKCCTTLLIKKKKKKGGFSLMSGLNFPNQTWGVTSCHCHVTHVTATPLQAMVGYCWVSLQPSLLQGNPVQLPISPCRLCTSNSFGKRLLFPLQFTSSCDLNFQKLLQHVHTCPLPKTRSATATLEKCSQDDKMPLLFSAFS